MCGIAGFMNRREQASLEVAQAQLATVNHRGPDACGVFVSGPVAIGQNRLAVIDLETGDPPITAADGRVGVALNGEIYNFQMLRRRLIEADHQFSTRGDTEVIAHLAEEESGVALASALDGMFAFAVWDRDTGQLILGRDRLGKKPLYWWCGSDCLVFGSEIKAVIAHPAVTAEIDESAIPSLLSFGYVPTPRTFYRGIQSLPPGCVLTVEKDLSTSIQRYWAPTVPGLDDAAAHLELSLPEASTLVGGALRDAVRRRLISDVPLGAFLSGGIDSSAVVAMMVEESSQPIRTFTIGFEDSAGFDERPYARMVADHFGTDHTELVVSPDAVDLIDRLVWHHDQPFGDSSAVPTYLLSEMTRRHVTVALSGDGGDEVFAGYERFAAGLLLDRASPALRAMAPLANRVARLVPPGKAHRFIGAALSPPPDGFRSLIGIAADPVVQRLVGHENGSWAVKDYRQRWESTRGATTLDRLLLLNLTTYLLDDLLPKVDRTSMAHGLEVRSPFLDTALVEMALRLPPATKLRGFSLKRCLRHAMVDRLPRAVLDRPKRGFGIPLDRWLREDLGGLIDSTLLASDSRSANYLVPQAISDVVAEHRSGSHSHGHLIWTLLTLEVFLRQRGW